ncbi:MAG TPA: ABC transporter substrate-binding protein [Acetobacteraceae bacterium]|nr:ABC transporter substrate-binding protein [Acetobacteraceae bacterium]
MRRPKSAARNGLSRRAMLTALAGASAATASAQGQTTTQAAGDSAATTPVIRVGYIRWMQRRPTISLLDKQAPNDGLAGAELAMADNNTTGRFLGLQYELTDVPVRTDDDVTAKLGPLVQQGARLVLTDVPADRVLKLADAARAENVIIFNIQAPDDSLRQQDCRTDVIHVAPSRAMLADALAEYLVWKKWSRWLLVHGSHPSDLSLRDAYRRSAKRYGAKIVQEREYKDTGGSRETDTGLVQTQQQMPVFTQQAPSYDVLVAADENQVFAGYLPYRTWDPRPVAGSAGLMPVSWDPSSESWGGTQMQDRFVRRFRRSMTQLDMQAWTAARMIGEASSRASSADAGKIMATMRAPNFQIGAYKDKALSIRDWNGQVRQAILLSDGRNVVSLSPQPGFLHQTNDLDTLGVDRPESTCKLT